jgi:hypothetical protein
VSSNHPVVGAPESVLRQHLVGLGREVAIGEEQQLHALAQLLFA